MTLPEKFYSNRNPFLTLPFCCLALAVIFVCGWGVPTVAAEKSLGDLTGPWQLLVDDFLIAEQSNLVRKYHLFKKHPQNPVLKADQPWEGSMVYVYGTVLPGEDGQGYRLWYHGYNNHTGLGGRGYFNAYAESDDGLTWRKPKLGIVEWQGSRENNLILPRKRSPGDDHHPQVIHTPWEKDPLQHYKLLTFAYYDGYWASHSADGIHWQDVPQNPVLVDPGDVGNFTWDPHKSCYLGYPKVWVDSVRGERRRCVAFTQTTDFKSWPKSRTILLPDEIDDKLCVGKAHFYGLNAFAYESMYIGFLWVYDTNGGTEKIDIQLASSHDGVNWTRQESPRKPILNLGPEGAWDDGMLFTTNHPLVEGNTIKLFYGGIDVDHSGRGGDGTGGVGLATLRKDGFASLEAGETIGRLTTKTLRSRYGPKNIEAKPLEGTLHVNFRAAPDGWLKVAVLDAEGQEIPGYGIKDSQPLSGDHVSQTVKWGNRGTLPSGGKPIRFHFLIKQAGLYSFAALPAETK